MCERIRGKGGAGSSRILHWRMEGEYYSFYRSKCAPANTFSLQSQKPEKIQLMELRNRKKHPLYVISTFSPINNILVQYSSRGVVDL